MKYRPITLVAGALVLTTPAPALAVDSASCKGSGDPHAGRQFTLGTDTAPITGNYTYAWDLDNDGTFETDTGREGTMTMERATAGTYTFGVRVTDGDLPAQDPKREARGKCDVTVANDKPISHIEAHPSARFPTAYEALRFHFTASDLENELNERPLTHAIDFDGDGVFEYTTLGEGEVYASFPAGFDKDIIHRVTDDAGESVDTRLRIKTVPDPFGIGDGRILGPLSMGPLGEVTARAPKTIKRKTLLKSGVVATFHWGATGAAVTVDPAIKSTTVPFSFQGGMAYAPGGRVAVKPLPPQLKRLVRKGAKKLLLRWTVKAEGPDAQGTLVVRITR